MIKEWLKMKFVKIKGPFGLRWGRLREWLRVIRAEGHTIPITDWFKMAKLSMHWPTDGALAKGRYSKCRVCPVFDRKLKRCRPYNGSSIGCGCYAPYAIVTGKRCWLRVNGVKTEHGYDL